MIVETDYKRNIFLNIVMILYAVNDMIKVLSVVPIDLVIIIYLFFTIQWYLPGGHLPTEFKLQTLKEKIKKSLE